MKTFNELRENLRKSIATNSSKFPEGSKVRCKKSGKTGKVLTVGKDFVKVAVDGGKDVDYKPSELTPLKESTAAYGKSQEKIRDKKKKDAISSSDKAKLAKLKKMMSKEEVVEENFKKSYKDTASYVVAFRNAKGKIETEVRADSKEKAEKQAAIRNKRVKPKDGAWEVIKTAKESVEEGYKSPAEAQAIADGKKAARQGKKYSDNPHKKGSKEFTAWSKGHNMARESVEESTKSHPQGSAKFYRGAMDKYKAKTPKKSPWDIYMDKHKTKKEGMTERRKDSAQDTYFNSYSAAVQHALSQAKKKGYEVDEGDTDSQITFGSGKPSKGKTVRHTLKLTKGGKEQRKALHIQVYNRGTDKNPFELNFYIS